MTLTVRKVLPSDFERFRPLMEEWIAECNPDGLKFDMDAELLIETFRMMATREQCTTLVMFVDGELIGCLGLIRHNWGACRTSNFATEHFWYVSKKHAGAGYSRQLIAAAKQWAAENDCDYLLFSTNRLSGGERSEYGDKLLASLGFRPLYGIHITEVGHV